MPEQAFVYILASGFKHLYIGVTTELVVRMHQHKSGTYPDSFTARYNIRHLVYLEQYAFVTTAIAREKQLKRWSRIKKLRLIVAANPTWKDLSEEWEQPLDAPTAPKLPPQPQPGRPPQPRPSRPPQPQPGTSSQSQPKLFALH